MSEADRRNDCRTTTQERRFQGSASRDHEALTVRSGRGWDWEAEEFSTADRAELEALRRERESSIGRIAELEGSLAAAGRREELLREGIGRLASARWTGRRKVMTELRQAGLLGP